MLTKKAPGIELLVYQGQTNVYAAKGAITAGADARNSIVTSGLFSEFAPVRQSPASSERAATANGSGGAGFGIIAVLTQRTLM
ncbi:hypothetical protein EVAR_86963_1 [Eumeta japonica]|uniref:Uncharacterized protein n=1 Tax=Eumeta variegata TaxID=151549 RepID=A0A4C1W748_EUMVA|nr:hypothetical protein EVAR_86963_1 [Eumeta japonica]